MSTTRAERVRRPLTKIVATIGPASSSEAVIEKLLAAGVSVFRFNFGHGTHAEHAERLERIRAAAAAIGRAVAVLGDLQGPKIRLGPVEGDGIDLAAGSLFVIQRETVTAVAPGAGKRPRFSATYESLVDDVQPGHRVLIADGAIRALAVEKSDDELLCTVTHGGRVTSGKGINLPDSDLRVKTLTDRDWDDVRWGIEHDLDLFALSFVRCADDVRDLAAGTRRILEKMDRPPVHVPIIAKIEMPQALEHIESIVSESDGIMVARGDLGVEMDLASVPVIQKRLIAVARDHGKPCIVATQMFESMISAPAPTRAEANDVAGAIFDQADAVMLSGETAVGKYPVVTVEHMRRVAEQTEGYLAVQPPVARPPRCLREARDRTAALAHGVWEIAHDLDAECIVVWSESGSAARYLSQNRFAVPIIAITSAEHAARRMQVMRGVIPVVMPVPRGLGGWTRRVDRYLQETDRASAGDLVILVAGMPLGREGVTNGLAIHQVGDPRGGFGGE